MDIYDMVEHLKKLYQGQACQERFDVLKELFQCKMVEGNPVESHVLKMIGYVENLERLGFLLSQELAIDLVLQLLPQNFSQIVMNYNMKEIDKPLSELLSTLRIVEQNL